MKQRLFAPIALSTLLVAGVVAYFKRPTVGHADASRADRRSVGLSPGETAPEVSGGCGMVARPRVSRDALNERYRWAHSLLDQKLYDAALPDLRDIETIDPGYPGINLDLSAALLQTRHPEEAKGAIDTQIAVSDCLAKLPVEALEAYCKTEFPQANDANCKPRLSQIRRTAQLQAALVHLELEHGMDPAPVAEAAESAVPAAQPPTHRSVAQLIAKPKRPTTETVHPVAPPKSSVDSSLRNGAGTDSDLGAYSKGPGTPE